MGWAIFAVIVMAMIGGALGAVGAYLWVRRDGDGASSARAATPFEEARGARHPGAPEPTLRLNELPARRGLRAPTEGPGGQDVAPRAPRAPLTAVRPLPPLRALPPQPAVARVHAAPLQQKQAEPYAAEGHLPPPGAVSPAVRVAGPRLRNKDEIVVHLPTGGAIRIASGVIVGRADGCRVHLRLARVSRRHAVIYKSHGSWWIGDLGSTNGTTVDGRPVHGAEALCVGSYVHVGGRGGVGFTVRDAVETADLESPSAA